MSDFNPGSIRAKQSLARKQGVTGADKGLELGAHHLLQVSRKLVPHEEGTLENSGKVTVDEATHQAAVSYSTPYAVPQHEDLSFKHDPGRQAKYLEQPMNTEADTMAKLVGREVKREMGT